MTSHLALLEFPLSIGLTRKMSDKHCIFLIWSKLGISALKKLAMIQVITPLNGSIHSSKESIEFLSIQETQMVLSQPEVPDTGLRILAGTSLLLTDHTS